MHLKIVFIAPLLFLICFELISAVILNTHGEYCNENRICNSSWLSCVNEHCECLNQRSQIYDTDKTRCVTKVGQHCSTGGQGDTTLECTPNAECKSNICVCKPEHYQTTAGNCTREKFFDEVCIPNEANDCYSPYGLTCVNGSCICNDDHYQDSNNKTEYCFTKKDILGPCRNNDECKGKFNMFCIDGVCNCDVKTHAYGNVQMYTGGERRMHFTGPWVKRCSPIVGELCPDKFCAPKTKCDWVWPDFRCSCAEGYSHNKNKTCSTSHKGYCTNKGDCADFLVCSNEKCECPFPDHQKFSRKLDKCVSDVGAHCTKDSSCLPNAFCKLLGEDGPNGHCECKEGYIEDRLGQCVGAFGQNCSKTTDCDSTAALICADNNCACTDRMYGYSTERRKCFGLVGAQCDDQDEYAITCAKNSECYQKPSVLKKKCRCKRGFTENPSDFTCV